MRSVPVPPVKKTESAGLPIFQIPPGVMIIAFGAPTVAGGIVFVGTGQGHLVVLGDPSIVPPAPEPTCSNPQYSAVFPPGRSACERFGFKPVPVPTILKDIAMPDSGNIAFLRKEPALAYGAVFVSTLGGHVYKLAP